MRSIPYLVLGFVLISAAAAEWHQWRGPGRDGWSAESGLLQQWPADGPARVWMIESLGSGYSSLAAGNGMLYTQGATGGRQFLIALDPDSGRTLWKTFHGRVYNDRRGDGPRGTPTLDGGRVYALGGDGNLICADAISGETVWEKHLLRTYGGRNIRWGISESPLIDQGRVVVNAGGRGASIVALDAESGAEVWKTQSDSAGYSSAVVAVVDGVRQYVVLTGEGVVGVKADNGELLWRYGTVSNSTANIATPILSGSRVFVSTAYGTGCALLRLERDGGSVRADEVYFSREMMNHYGSSVLIDGYLYGFSGRVLKAMRLDTGELAWRDRSVGKGQLIHADGRLYLLSEGGTVGLADPDPGGYREVSRFSIPFRDHSTWTLPVISDGRLYLRDQERLYSYDVRAR